MKTKIAVMAISVFFLFGLAAEIDKGQNSLTAAAQDDGWKNLVDFRMDLTGPDSGLGWDLDDEVSPTDIEFRDDRTVVFTDIYWQGENTDNYWDSGGPEGETLDEHYPPMCGDDQREYLLEEMGESVHSEKFEGRYACVDDNDYCIYRGTSGRQVFEIEETINTNEEGENHGRLKQDEAVCAQRPGLSSDHGMSRDHDPVPQWYDQDYANEISGTGSISVPDQNLCRENSLWGTEGVRWIDSDYIGENPLAVTGGIDDSWNPRLEQMNHPYLISDPDGENWDEGENPIEQGYSPVPTGVQGLHDGKVADPTNMDYGFCVGDDASEYLIHQESQTRHIDSDTSVVGAAENPRRCVLDDDLIVDHDAGNVLYEEGETEDVHTDEGIQEISCFAGEWWGEWPVVFLEDTAQVGLGQSAYSTFRVINPESSSRDIELELSYGKDELETMVSFASTDTAEMETTVPAMSSRVYDVEIRGNQEIEAVGDNDNLQLFGESTQGDLQGTDNLNIIVDSDFGEVQDAEGEVRDIPGLQLLQLVVIGLIASIVVFVRN